MNLLKRMLPAVLALAMSVSVVGQVDTTNAKKKVLSKRAAEADAYRKLAECIRGIQITSDTYVKDFVAESDVIQTELDAFIRGVRLGKPKWYADFSCEVRAEVTGAKVVQTLKAIHERHYKGDRVKGSDYEKMTQRVNKKVLEVVGMGAPREDLPPNLPAGVEVQIGGPPAAPEAPIPDLWQRVGPQGRLMAKRAAEVDAQRKLIERIIGLRVDSQTLVRDFVAESDVINTVARGTLVGHSIVRVYYHHDEPICEVTVEVPLKSVLTTIKELHSRTIKGDNIKGVDYTKVTQQIKSKTFQATGMGIPRQQFLAKVEQATQTSFPDWAQARIKETGNGVPPGDKQGTAQGKLMAARAAELDAKRKLAERIYGLSIDSSTAVRDFVAEHDEISSHMEAVLVNSMVDKTTFDGEVAQVTVSIPGMQVWQIVHERIRVTKIGG